MTLNSIGKIDQYAHVFDVKKYKRKAEFLYTCRQVFRAKTDPYAKGNVKLANENGINLPPRSICFIVLAYFRIYHDFKRLSINSAEKILPEKILLKVKKYLM
jgi:hypothetical protein